MVVVIGFFLLRKQLFVVLGATYAYRVPAFAGSNVALLFVGAISLKYDLFYIAMEEVFLSDLLDPSPKHARRIDQVLLISLVKSLKEDVGIG